MRGDSVWFGGRGRERDRMGIWLMPCPACRALTQLQLLMCDVTSEDCLLKDHKGSMRRTVGILAGILHRQLWQGAASVLRTPP